MNCTTKASTKYARMGAVRIQSLEISTATFLRRVAVGPATSLTTACCAHAMGQDGCHEGTRQVRARVGASVEADAWRACRHVRAVSHVRHQPADGIPVDPSLSRRRSRSPRAARPLAASAQQSTRNRAARRGVHRRRAKERPRWGARKLRAWLADRYPGRVWPSASCIADILKRRGLAVPRRRRRRVVPLTQPFAACDRPNAVWCVDFKGWFRTGDGEKCYPLTLIDAYSRYLLRCEGVIDPDGLVCSASSIRRSANSVCRRRFAPTMVHRLPRRAPAV